MRRANDSWTPLWIPDHPRLSRRAEPSALPADPVQFAIEKLGFTPDPTQSEILRAASRRIILCMGRRCGKTYAISTRALHFALTHPLTDTLIFSRSQRQANILLGHTHRFLAKLAIRRRGDGLNPDSLLLPNGSRILSLPPNPDTVLGFTPDLLILDEAARIPDSLYFAVSPMLAFNDPILILLSTPNGRRGFFYREWTSSQDDWHRFFSPATQCPRISQRFLESERAKKPEMFFRQEYECEFLDAAGAFFPESLLERAIDRSLDPYTPPFANLNAFPRETKQRTFFVGVDLGQAVDYTAITVLERLQLMGQERDPVYLTFPERWEYRVRHMERLPLQTAYHQVVDHVVALVQRLKGAAMLDRIELVIDATSGGMPVVEMFRNARPQCGITPVSITSGDFVSTSGGTHRVPKRDLMNRLHLTLEDNILRIPSKLPALEAFSEEFCNFRLRYTQKGTDTYSAEGRIHDDLILSLALSTWRAT